MEDVNFSKLFIAAGGGVIGAIVGGSFAGWRASLALNRPAPNPEEVGAIAATGTHAFGASAAAVIKGVLMGGILGVILVVAVMVFLGAERVRRERKFDDLGD